MALVQPLNSNSCDVKCFVHTVCIWNFLTHALLCLSALRLYVSLVRILTLVCAQNGYLTEKSVNVWNCKIYLCLVLNLQCVTGHKISTNMQVADRFASVTCQKNNVNLLSGW